MDHREIYLLLAIVPKTDAPSPANPGMLEPFSKKKTSNTESFPLTKIPSTIKWDLANGRLSKLLELLDTQV